MTARLPFIFDFISPYAYLGWHRAKQELAPLGVTLEPHPVLFAAMLDANATNGPAEIPAKRIYTWKHVVRLAHEQERKIQPPPAHPFNPLLALRIVSAIDDIDQRTRAVDAIFAAAWERGDAITDAAYVGEVLKAVGLDGAGLVRATANEDTKQRLKDATAWAIGQGVFGVPSYLVGDEVFWGQDSVPHVVAHLRGQDPAAGALERWRDLPVGTSRIGSRERR
ncbi:MAG: 2-hydroxychromene-2-carboxylate isomerase [Pseudomonadota bacterium]